MKTTNYIFYSLTLLIMLSCNNKKEQQLEVEIYETSKSGNALTNVKALADQNKALNTITLLPEKQLQTITGFGGSFTESSASLLNRWSKNNREKIIEAYFGESGARYSLTRTHMNSCDFSISNYSYTPVEGDIELKHFSIEEDRTITAFERN